MSCRVLKREMEFAMFDALVEQCQARGIRKIVGVYIPSKKNSMVAGHYAGLGFSRVDGTHGGPASCGTTTCLKRIRQERATFAGPQRALPVGYECLNSSTKTPRQRENDNLMPIQWQVEVDRSTPDEWSRMLDLFDDANIYQTWSYGEFAGEEKTSATWS